MIKGKLTIVFVLLSMLALSLGCSGSGNGGSGVLPDAQPPASEMRDVTGYWGLYQVSIDLNTKGVDIIQLRQADLILNVLGFMEPPVMVNMFIDFNTLVLDPDNDYIGVDVTLKHPIPDDVFKGFDVRGICFGPEVTNADGHTVMMNPADFSGEPFGYIDGALGAPNSYANYDGIWGYKYFCDDLGLDDDPATFFGDEDNLLNRGVFNEGSQNSRHYDLSYANAESPIDFMVFNYAIYANYNWPDGDPPFDIDAFSITSANSEEAFCFTVEEVDNSLYYDEGASSGGGAISLNVEVWDWQGAESQIVTVESFEAGIIAETASDADSAGTTSKSHIFTFTDVAAVPTSVGDLDILIKATDPVITFGDAWFLDMLGTGNAYYDELIWCGYVYVADVGACPMPTVESVDPAGGTGILDDVEFTCTNLIAGGSLGAKFVQGTEEYVGTDATFISGTSMTADFDLTGASSGTYDITITNGCGTEGTGPAQFTAATIVPHSGAPPGGGFIDVDSFFDPHQAIDIGINPDSQEIYILIDGGSVAGGASDPNDGTCRLLDTAAANELGWIDLYVANPTSYPNSKCEYGDAHVDTGTSSTSVEGITLMLWPAWHWYANRGHFTDGNSGTNGGGIGYVGYGQPDVPADSMNFGTTGSNLQSVSWHAFYFFGSTDYRAIITMNSNYDSYVNPGLYNPGTTNFDGVYDLPDSNLVKLTGGATFNAVYGLFEAEDHIRPYNTTFTAWGSGITFGTDAEVVNPVDISTDNETGYIYVLDSPSGTDYRLTGYDPATGNIVAGSGTLSDTDAEPYALDYSEVGDCMYVLFDDNTFKIFKDVANT